VAGAPPGVSARIGSPYSGRRGLARTMGADPLLGFQPSRGFPLLALTRPTAENASIFRSYDRVSPRALRGGVPKQAGHRRFRVSIGGEVGWSLSRLPPLLRFLSSSWLLAPGWCVDACALTP
jgi:hypothetical protein